MNYKPFAIAMIVGSVIIEAICFYNIYILKSGGLSVMLIMPILSLIAGLYILFSKEPTDDNSQEKDESE